MIEKLNGFKPYVKLQVPTVYDDTLTYYETVTQVIAYLNDVIDKSNDLIGETNEFHVESREKAIQLRKEFEAFGDDVLNNLVPVEVVDTLNQWQQDGKLADLINDQVFGMKANQVDLDDTNRQLAHTIYVLPSDNDNEVIHKALEQLRDLGGGTVKLSTGRFTVNKSIIMYENTNLIGSGKDTILTGEFGGRRLGLIGVGNYDGSTEYNADGNITIQNLSIDTPETNGLTMCHTSNVHVSDIWNIDCYDHFYDIAAIKDSVFERLYFYDKCRTAPFQFDGFPGSGTNRLWDGSKTLVPEYDHTPSDNVILRDSIFDIKELYSNLPYAIHFHKGLSQNILIDNVQVNGRSEGLKYGVYIDPNTSGYDNITIKNSTFLNLEDAGIYLRDAEIGYLRLENNVINNCLDAVSLKGINKVDIISSRMGKFATQLTGRGLYIDSVDDLTVNNCYIEGYRMGIDLLGDGEKVVITNTAFDRVQTGILRNSDVGVHNSYEMSNLNIKNTTDLGIRLRFNTNRKSQIVQLNNVIINNSETSSCTICDSDNVTVNNYVSINAYNKGFEALGVNTLIVNNCLISGGLAGIKTDSSLETALISNSVLKNMNVGLDAGNAGVMKYSGVEFVNVNTNTTNTMGAWQTS